MARPSVQPAEQKGLHDQRPEVVAIRELLKKGLSTLRDHHALGEQVRLLEEDPTVKQRGSSWRKKLAELVGCSEPTLTKALRFRRAYQEKDLPSLEKEGFDWTRLTLVLGIKDPQQRHQFLRQADEKKLSNHDLGRALQQRKGSRRGGGRPRRQQRSQGVLADALDLVSVTESWLKHHRDVWELAADGYAAEVQGLDESARQNLAEVLAQASGQLQDLLKRARQAKATVEALRKGLPPPQKKSPKGQDKESRPGGAEEKG